MKGMTMSRLLARTPATTAFPTCSGLSTGIIFAIFGIRSRLPGLRAQYGDSISALSYNVTPTRQPCRSARKACVSPRIAHMPAVSRAHCRQESACEPSGGKIRHRHHVLNFFRGGFVKKLPLAAITGIVDDDIGNGGLALDALRDCRHLIRVRQVHRINARLAAQ